MGEKLDMHPVVILFSLVLWGFIWGLPGMLMAAPLTAVTKIIFSHIDTLKPVARIIEGRLP
jgi:AI-2 transport protein TqsA